MIGNITALTQKGLSGGASDLSITGDSAVLLR